MLKAIVDALDAVVPLQGLLGYLNFSEGKPDPGFQKQWGDAYAFLAEGEFELPPNNPEIRNPWELLRQCLLFKLNALHEGQAAAFRDIEQVRSVIELAYESVVPAYRAQHADLLFHLQDADFWQPFFLMRVVEAVLAQRGPWDDRQRILEGALHQINDFVGHRPVAVLESRPRGEPYDREKVRPIPLFIKNVGVAHGRYQVLVQQALQILQKAHPNVLADAHFDLDLLDELCLDPRGYDFGHPVEKRPNYCFGEWDPHLMDSQGRFRRFVLRQVTLDGLWQRVERAKDNRADRSEKLFEASAVLAGIILMASSVSGARLSSHDSSISLSTLVPIIARMRDAFYADLIREQTGATSERLGKDAQITRQPFGGARQSLNHFLANERARQVQQRHLALLLAELGYPAAARRQVADIPVASVRLLTEMHVRLTTGLLLVEKGKLEPAATLLPEIEDLLQRGIRCGAVVDPWNILGFQGQYPRFHSLEDSVRDSRIDDLCRVMDRLFHLYSRVITEGAALPKFDAGLSLTRDMDKLAEWWDKFATTSVSDVPHVDGGEAVASAQHVARAMVQWRDRGEADLSFWKQHLEGFRSSKAFALVLEALLGKEDWRASMALLMTWLSQAEEVPLADGDHSFHTLSLRWMMGVCAASGASREEYVTDATLHLVAKFFDYLEANADDHWRVPHLNPLGLSDEEQASQLEKEDEGDSLYGAAYEGVTFQDSTDDDVDAEVLDFMPQKDFDLSEEEPRLEKRLQFLSTLARLWNIATRVIRYSKRPEQGFIQDNVRGWLKHARENYRHMLNLLDTIHEHEIPKPSGAFDAMIEFDRRRGIKERLLGLSITTCMDQALAVGALRGVSDDDHTGDEGGPSWAPLVLQMERSLLRKDDARVRELVGEFLTEFSQEPLLYTPLTHGGHPRQVLRAGLAQTILRGLVANLPRQGLIRETWLLIRNAQIMEHNQEISGPRVTEFDRLFQLGCQAVVEAVIESALVAGDNPDADAEGIVVTLEAVMEPFVAVWLEHSQTLRVAVLESIARDSDWERLTEFIQRFGKDIFHARFLALGNLRGILHRGVGNYLDYLRDNPDPMRPVALIDALERDDYPREEAIWCLHLILQTLIENFQHLTEYNAVTTQSDYGGNLYQLMDFLRLKASYERQGWQMKPFNLVHEILARRHGEAAAVWREKIQEITQEPAEQHLEELVELEKKYGMRLTTIRDRLEERFVTPMAIDRLCALIEPAFQQAKDQLNNEEPTELERELQPFVDNPTGVGFEVPGWLSRLEAELVRVQTSRSAIVNLAETLFQVPKVAVPFDQLAEQMKDWKNENESS